jgi:hypothetical protein
MLRERDNARMLSFVCFQTTVSTQLAALLGVPYICLDALFWKPGWEKETNAQFRANVERALADAPHGWVVDGNYGRRIGTVVEDSATDVICASFALFCTSAVHDRRMEFIS